MKSWHQGVSMVRTSFSADFDLFSIRLRQSLLNTHESPAGRSISSHLCAKRRRQFLVLVWAATFCFCFCLAIAIAFAALAATSIPAQLWALSFELSARQLHLRQSKASCWCWCGCCAAVAVAVATSIPLSWRRSLSFRDRLFTFFHQLATRLCIL